jgi:hypothetical protein
LKKLLEKIDPELLYADGYDDCILGMTFREEVPVVLYSTQKVIRKLENDMSHADACDHFYFNMDCAYVGPRTPVFFDSELEEDDS